MHKIADWANIYYRRLFGCTAANNCCERMFRDARLERCNSCGVIRQHLRDHQAVTIKLCLSAVLLGIFGYWLFLLGTHDPQGKKTQCTLSPGCPNPLGLPKRLHNHLQNGPQNYPKSTPKLSVREQVWKTMYADRYLEIRKSWKLSFWHRSMVSRNPNDRNIIIYNYI